MTFLDWYLQYCGESEVPKRWHHWACLSLIGAAVADRVVVDRGGSTYLAPNLYVFLIGPSGSGKEYAISKATNLAKDILTFNIHSGEITTRGIYNFLSQLDEHKNFKNTKCWLIMEELAQSISLKEEGRRVIRLLTKLYGRDVLPLDNTTGKWKHVSIPSPCVNALIGTTKEWLFDTVSKTDIYSGYFARIQSVVDQRNYTNLHPTITRPLYYHQIQTYLKWRLEWYTTLKAIVSIHPLAREWHDRWYRGSKPPDDELLIPHYNRRDELLHKIALILVISRTDPERYQVGETLCIQLEDYTMADVIIRDVQKDITVILDQCGQGGLIAHVELVGRLIRRYHTIAHRDLLQRVSSRGVSAQVLRQVIEHLEQEEKIQTVDFRPTKYQWIG